MGVCQRVFLALIITSAAGVAAESTLIYQPSDPATRSGDPSSIDVYKYTNKQGVTSFSDRAPTNAPYRVIRINPDCFG